MERRINCGMSQSASGSEQFTCLRFVTRTSSICRGSWGIRAFLCRAEEPICFRDGPVELVSASSPAMGRRQCPRWSCRRRQFCHCDESTELRMIYEPLKESHWLIKAITRNLPPSPSSTAIMKCLVGQNLDWGFRIELANSVELRQFSARADKAA